MNNTTTEALEYGWVVIGKRNGLEILDKERVINTKNIYEDTLMGLLQIPLEYIDLAPETTLYNLAKLRHRDDIYTFYGVYIYAKDDAGRNGFIGIAFVVLNQVLKPEAVLEYWEVCKKILPNLKLGGEIKRDKEKLLTSDTQIKHHMDTLRDFIALQKKKEANQYETPNKMPYPSYQSPEKIFYVPKESGADHLKEVLKKFHSSEDNELSYYRNIFTTNSPNQAIVDSLAAHVFTLYENGQTRRKDGEVIRRRDNTPTGWEKNWEKNITKPLASFGNALKANGRAFLIALLVLGVLGVFIGVAINMNSPQNQSISVVPQEE